LRTVFALIEGIENASGVVSTQAEIAGRPTIDRFWAMTVIG
jgi:hypothetical protein